MNKDPYPAVGWIPRIEVEPRGDGEPGWWVVAYGPTDDHDCMVLASRTDREDAESDAWAFADTFAQWSDPDWSVEKRLEHRAITGRDIEEALDVLTTHAMEEQFEDPEDPS